MFVPVFLWFIHAEEIKPTALPRARALSRDTVLLSDPETLALKTKAAMAYSAPGRYAGVLQALEALRVDLDTAPLPALITLVRSIDSDLADRATTELWDRDRLLITMRDEALPLPQCVDAPIAAAAPAALGPPASDAKTFIKDVLAA